MAEVVVMSGDQYGLTGVVRVAPRDDADDVGDVVRFAVLPFRDRKNLPVTVIITRRGQPGSLELGDDVIGSFGKTRCRRPITRSSNKGILPG